MWQNQAEEARDNVMEQLTESRNILEQTQLSHNVVVQGLQRQLHDASEGPTAAEGDRTCNFGKFAEVCSACFPKHQITTSDMQKKGV